MKPKKKRKEKTSKKKKFSIVMNEFGI